MVSFQQRFLAATLVALSAAAQPRGLTPRFRPDDPLTAEPRPRPVTTARARNIDDIYDFAFHSFATRGIVEKELAAGLRIAARDINTLGEVLDSTWYTNRHRNRRLTSAEIAAGPGNQRPPSSDGAWKLIAAKSDGVTPGFTVEDSAGRRYVIKFDPVDLPEMSSGADIIGSKLFYALGYDTAENYIVRFDPAKLTVAPGTNYTDKSGRPRPITRSWVDRMLRPQPRDASGRVRALASLLIEGTILGPYRYRGVRADDPNDIYPHEQRRSLRGLAVFCAWTNHTDSRAINSLDTIQTRDGVSAIRHYLIDFGSAFGSDSIFKKEPSRGHVFDIEFKPMARNMATLGLIVEPWERVRYPKLRGIGNFEDEIFEPRRWKSAYPNPAFLRMDEEDAFWAAKQVAAFRDEDLDQVAAVAGYSDPQATAYMASVLKGRRDRIAAAYLGLPLRFDEFRVEGGRLVYTDWSARIPSAKKVEYESRWLSLDPRSGQERPIEPVTDLGQAFGREPLNAILGVRYQVRGDATAGSVTAYLRREASAWRVVGVVRDWPEQPEPGKAVARARPSQGSARP